MFENIPREKVLEVVKAKGPLIPVKIVKELGGNTFIIGAVLSDLMSSKVVKATLALRIGATPIYYVPGQEEKLLDFIQYLNEKDRRTLTILKDQRILMDKAQDPLTRVCLQNLKDFAMAFSIDSAGEKTLFWRFFLIPEPEAVEVAKGIAAQDKAARAPVSVPATAPPTPADTQTPPTANFEPATPHPTGTPSSPTPSRPAIKAATRAPPESPSAIHTPRAAHPAETQKDVKEFISAKPKPDSFEAAVKKKEEELAHIGEAKARIPTPSPGSFAEKVFTFLSAKGIEIKEVLLVKKGEVNLIVAVPSPVGPITQYCKAREKKSISDGDLATATLEGQTKGIPILFLATGALSKKAEKMLHEGAKNLSFVKF